MIITLFYQKTKYRAYFYMAASWFALMCFYMFNCFGFWFDSDFWIYACSFSFIPMGFFLDLMIDSITRQSIEPIKLTILTILSTSLVFLAFQPNAITSFPLENGDYGWDWNGNFKTAVMIISILPTITWTIYTIKLYFFAPSTEKAHALI